MNYLAHLYIAQATKTSYAGALLGDHVRGRLNGQFNAWIEDGIHLHRRVDTFTDSHPLVLGAFQCLSPPFRRYAGILVDVYFDHALARRWPAFHSVPLGQFTRQAAARVRAEWPEAAPFPAERLAKLSNLLQSYQTSSGIADALAAIDRRLSRPSPLPQAWPHLRSHAAELFDVFDAFFPELLNFAQVESGCCSSIRAPIE